jgi:hypothetical protein
MNAEIEPKVITTAAAAEDLPMRPPELNVRTK